MKIDPEIFSEGFHTALRKACDSKPTSAMWNACHAVHHDAWGLWASAMVASLKGVEFVDLDELAELANRANEDMDVHSVMDGFVVPDPMDEHQIRTGIFTIKNIGELMEPGDWRGAVAYLGDE